MGQCKVAAVTADLQLRLGCIVLVTTPVALASIAVMMRYTILEMSILAPFRCLPKLLYSRMCAAFLVASTTGGRTLYNPVHLTVQMHICVCVCGHVSPFRRGTQHAWP